MSILLLSCTFLYISPIFIIPQILLFLTLHNFVTPHIHLNIFFSMTSNFSSLQVSETPVHSLGLKVSHNVDNVNLNNILQNCVTFVLTVLYNVRTTPHMYCIYVTSTLEPVYGAYQQVMWKLHKYIMGEGTRNYEYCTTYTNCHIKSSACWIVDRPKAYLSSFACKSI